MQPAAPVLFKITYVFTNKAAKSAPGAGRRFAALWLPAEVLITVLPAKSKNKENIKECGVLQHHAFFL